MLAKSQKIILFSIILWSSVFWALQVRAEDDASIYIYKAYCADNKLVVNYETIGDSSKLQVGHVVIQEKRDGWFGPETQTKRIDAAGSYTNTGEEFEIPLSYLEGNTTLDYINEIQIEYNYHGSYRTAKRSAYLYLRGVRATATIVYFADGYTLSYTAQDSDTTGMASVNNAFENASNEGLDAVKIKYSTKYFKNRWGIEGVYYAYISASNGFSTYDSDLKYSSELDYIKPYDMKKTNSFNRIVATCLKKSVEGSLQDKGVEIMDSALAKMVQIVDGEDFVSRILVKKPTKMIVGKINLIAKVNDIYKEINGMEQKFGTRLNKGFTQSGINKASALLASNPAKLRDARTYCTDGLGEYYMGTILLKPEPIKSYAHPLAGVGLVELGTMVWKYEWDGKILGADDILTVITVLGDTTIDLVLVAI